MLPTLEANQVIRLHGLTDGDGRLAPLRRNPLPGGGQRPVDVVDQFREIRRVHCITTDMRRYNLSPEARLRIPVIVNGQTVRS